ncbi:TadG family pilus assembly protein [Mesorhizobium sp. DCY119]|jgi:uncharacterized membrane protein|uniref:TadG family pilus assembly protein n=1 Tax=Mesorhizobium sp. DCY119 TaxID=2108445 RepID=UPI000E6BAC9B|nr:TadG family pilus assembly protein [Mesorhizobium sp. DCY119]RJG45944.1 hypothetical protein D3Y55_17955 [Mesorhizobium sp. DCY119]
MQYCAQVRKIFFGKSFCSSISGNIAIMTALTMPVAVVIAAVAIDEASLYSERREAQSLVDIAAITAAANLSKAEAAVTATFRDNGITDIVVGSVSTQPPAGVNGIKPTVTITPGRYVANASAAVGTRFQAGTQPYNAVKVTFKKTGARYFAGALIAPPTIATQAIAGTKTEAAFSVGSRLASLDGGVLNSLLTGLVGGNVNLSLMDYNALLSADVSVFSFLDSLATKLNIKAGTYSDVLNSTATVGQIVSAMAAIPGQQNAAKVALEKIAGVASANVTVPLKKVLGLGSAASLGLGQRPAGLSADVNVLQMLTAGLVMADGKKQLGLDLNVSVLGLASAKLDMAIGEPPQSSPWYTIGETGAVVRTAQTRIKLIIGIGGGLEPLVGQLITLPIYADLAYAEASLTEISCPTGPDSRRVKIAARPGVAEIRIADISSAAMQDFRTKPKGDKTKVVSLQVLFVGLVSIWVEARAAIDNQNVTTLTFTNQQIKDRAIQKVSTRDLTTSLVKSLLGDLKLEARLLDIIPVGVPTGVTKSLGDTLGAVTPGLDTLLYNVLTMLGVRVGEADVQVNGATCGRSVLVQ